MTNNSQRKSASRTKRAIAYATLLCFVATEPALAATDISSQPLASTTTAQVKPNIMYLMDTSGSMAWGHMPDDEAGNVVSVGYKNNLCNTMYYNPNLTYVLPKNSDGTNRTAPSFTSASPDGYLGGTAVNLSTSFRAYTTTTGNTGSSDSSQAAYYYSYSGGSLLTWNGSPCTQSAGTSPFAASGQNPPGSATDTNAPAKPSFTVTAVTGVTGSGYTAANAGNYAYEITAFNNIGESAPTALSAVVNIAVGGGAQLVITDGGGSVPATGYRIYKTATGANGTGTVTSTLAPARSSTNGVFNSTTTVVTAANPGTWTKVIVSSTSGVGGTDETQNFANWYTYYRTRILMMKSAATRAFVQLTDSYRVGFVIISPSSPVSTGGTAPDFVPMADYTTANKATWFSAMTNQTVGSSTPLREALSRVGRYYAGKANGINSGMGTDDGSGNLTAATDPIQYSCQQNFTVLTTDGFWNGNGGRKVDNSSLTDTWDSSLSVDPRPMWDGGSDSSTIVTDKSNAYQYGSCTAVQERDQQIQKRTRHVDASVNQTTEATVNIIVGSSGSRPATISSILVGATNILTASISSNSSTASTRQTAIETGIAGAIGGGYAVLSSGSCTGSNNPVRGCANGSLYVRIMAPAGTGNFTGAVTNNAASITVTAQNDSGGGASFSGGVAGSTPTTVAADATTCAVNGVSFGSPATSTHTRNTFTACTQTSDTGFANASSCAAGFNGTDTISCQTTDTGLFEVSSCSASSSGGLTVTCTNETSNGGKKVQYKPTTTTTTTFFSGGIQIGNPSTSTSTAGSWSNLDGACYQTRTLPSLPTAGRPGTGVPPLPANPCTAWPCTTTSGGSSGATGTLADVAAYYYQNDLRSSMTNNVPGTGQGTEADTATWQHMTTFTMGLGVPGTLVYRDDYKTAVSGDFQQLRDGTRIWPTPVADDPTALDDLWHAAVNGRGQFFSAANPSSVVNGLTTALAGINARVASAAAAATSNLEPVAGDNFAYTAKYVTQQWVGEIEAHQIDLETGQVLAGPGTTLPAITNVSNATPIQVTTTTAHGLASGDHVQIDSVGGTTNANSGNWVVTVVDATNFTLNGSVGNAAYTGGGNATKLQIVWTAQSALDAKTNNACDNRTIYLFRAGAASNRTSFTWNTSACDSSGSPTGTASTGLNSSEQANFSSTQVALLSQYPTMTDGSGTTVDQRGTAVGANLVNFLRGQRGLEGFTTNDLTKLYRARTHVLGDIVNAQPVFVRAPFADYTDAGYSTFKANNNSRAGALYVAANDGMLHSFNADTGVENWAFIPSQMLPNLYKLADNNYANGHKYFTDGTPELGDIYDNVTAPGTPVWKTILVGGYNAGGSGYYALDVTDPANPIGMWEFKNSATCFDPTSAATIAATNGADCHLGLSFGNPVISKLTDGTWVVFVTSGYNNDDGGGYLYALNAVTGKIIFRMATGVGSTGSPSGLNHINNWVDNTLADNTTQRMYGVDIIGNVWRFDTANNVGTNGLQDTWLIGTAKDTAATPAPQPITTRPELAEVSGSPYVFFATGRLLGTTDLTNTQKQSIYGVKDTMGEPVDASNNPVAVYTDLRGSLKPETITQVGSGSTATRTVACSGSTTQCASSNGWVVDLPESGERVNVDMKLQLGTVVVASNVPDTDACSIGGHSWLNFFNYATGTAVANSAGGSVGQFLSASLAVGLNIIRLPSGKTVVITTTSDAKQTTIGAPFDVPAPTGKRISWREISQ